MSERRSSIIDAIRSPLGFFTLVALVIEAVLLAAVAATNEVSLWAPLAVLVLLVGTVAAIAVLRPNALYAPRQVLNVTFLFPKEYEDIQLERDQSFLEVTDPAGRKKLRRVPDLVLGPGGYWAVRLRDIDEGDAVRLGLVDIQQRRWLVRPFAPYSSTQQAVPDGGP